MGFDEKSRTNSVDEFSSSHEPLLNDRYADMDSERGDEVKRSNRSWWPYAVHMVVFIAYNVAFLVALSNMRSTPRLTYNAAPVSENLPLRISSYDDEAMNEFRGKPRPELDMAWHNLLQHANVRLSSEELRKMNRTAVELHDGSGYYGAMNVYHHLHCLKTVRQFIHEDYYHTGIKANDHHLDHCLDAIRLALMCHPDTAVATYDWHSDHRKPKPNPNVHRTCINWDALDQWSAQRSFDTFDQKSLVHPEFGIVYPLINGTYELAEPGSDMHIIWPEE